MRVLLIFTFALIAAAAENPVVTLLNLTRPQGRDFQIGDRFEIQIAGAPNQPISVRTTRRGRTDWGPIVASTDSTGRWSTSRQLEESDFGGWSEIWTVGGRLAAPAIRFDVQAPCLPGGPGHAIMSGPNVILTCDTVEGPRTFASASDSAAFRTPDGRLVPGRALGQTAEQYQMEILDHFITSGELGAARMSLQSSRGGLGDEAADLISRLIGINGLSENEIRNVLAIIRSVFEKAESIAPSAKEPSRTLLLLRHLADLTDEESLKKQIADTMVHVQAR
jgi:hypothetical protein